VALPGNSSLERKNAEEQSAISDRDCARDENGGERLLEDSTRQEEAQVAEDEAAGADVISERWGEEPNAKAAGQRDEDGNSPEHSYTAQQHGTAEDDEGE